MSSGKSVLAAPKANIKQITEATKEYYKATYSRLYWLTAFKGILPNIVFFLIRFENSSFEMNRNLIEF